MFNILKEHDTEYYNKKQGIGIHFPLQFMSPESWRTLFLFTLPTALLVTMPLKTGD